MTSRTQSLTTSLLVLLAVGTGAWKILDLSAANRELDRQNRAYASSFEEIRQTLEAVRKESLRRGSPAAGFTLLGLDGSPVRFDPTTEQEAVHLLFLDPGGPARVGDTADAAGKSFEELLENYGKNFGPSAPETRVLVLAQGGFEASLAALAGMKLRYPVTVHAGDVYRKYGFIEGPGLAIVQGGVVREKWRLPYRGDEIPLD